MASDSLESISIYNSSNLTIAAAAIIVSVKFSLFTGPCHDQISSLSHKLLLTCYIPPMHYIHFWFKGSRIMFYKICSLDRNGP